MPAHPAILAPSDDLLHLVEQMQRVYCLFSEDQTLRQTVVVAVSGGMDSVCLLHVLSVMAPVWQLDLHVAHVDHALRPQSTLDMVAVRDLAAQLRLPFHTVRLDGDALRADPVGLEAAARRARYRFLCATAINVTRSALVPVLAVAHHSGDQAETFLLRAVQGSGLTGLAAMRTVAEIAPGDWSDRPVRLVRPLLAASRAAIRAYVLRNQLTWREDESNADMAIRRNLMRHEVLPLLERLNPRVVDALARTAALLADDADRLHALDQDAFRTRVTYQDADRLLLDLAALRQLNPSAMRGVLRTALAQMGADLRTIGAVQLASLATAVARESGLSGPHPLADRIDWSTVAEFDGAPRLALHHHAALPILPPGPWLDPVWRKTQVRLRLPINGEVEVGDWILECSTVERSQLQSDWRRNRERWTAFFDAGTTGSPVLTTPRNGLLIDPLGMEGKRKQVGDLFTDAKIAPPLRSGWPIVERADGERAFWICGLTQSHATRVTEQTARVWIVRWRRRRERGKV